MDLQSVNNCCGDAAGKLDAEEGGRGSKSPSPTHNPPDARESSTSLPDVPIITQEEVDTE